MKIRKLLAFVVVFGCGVQFASAQAQFLNVFQTEEQAQTGASSYGPTFYYGAERIDSSGTVLDPTSATATRPTGQVDALAQVDPTQLQYQDNPAYNSLSAFNAAWTNGDYTFVGDLGTYTGTVNNPGPGGGIAWSSTPAMVTNYAALTSGLAPNQPFTVDFTSWTPNANATLGTATYVALFDDTNHTTADSAILAAGATSWTMSALDLLPNSKYELVIDDDNRLEGPSNPNFQGALSDISYDNKTDVFFQTVPEPGPFAVVGLGVLGLLVRRRNRR